MVVCPLCGSRRVRHRLGSHRWFCLDCHTVFYDVKSVRRD